MAPDSVELNTDSFLVRLTMFTLLNASLMALVSPSISNTKLVYPYCPLIIFALTTPLVLLLTTSAIYGVILNLPYSVEIDGAILLKLT